MPRPRTLFDAVSKKTDGRLRTLFTQTVKKTGGRAALIAVLLAVGAVSACVAAAAPAQADLPCAEFDVCQYMPNPYNNGQLQPTWELPGGYGLPGGSPTICDPKAYKCYPATPGSGF
jgi:hypothetical protein